MRRDEDHRYGVAHLSEIEPLASDIVEGEWLPVRLHFGIGAFGCNAYRAHEAGALIVEEHSEPEHEELYVVLDGEARFTLDGDEVSAKAGTFVHCPPAVVRKAVAVEPETTILALGSIPGRAFSPTVWEAERTP